RKLCPHRRMRGGVASIRTRKCHAVRPVLTARRRSNRLRKLSEGSRDQASLLSQEGCPMTRHFVPCLLVGFGVAGAAVVTIAPFRVVADEGDTSCEAFCEAVFPDD